MFTVKIIMIYLTILLMLLLCICEQIAPVVPLQDTFISYAICVVLLNTLKSLFSNFSIFLYIEPISVFLSLRRIQCFTCHTVEEYI